MGIPRLAGLLEPYAVPVLLGHKANPCSSNHPEIANSLFRDQLDPHLRSLIIDGPALVHFIYGRLLCCLGKVESEPDRIKPIIQGVSSIVELPSYESVNHATQVFLDALQDYGLQVAVIYFDAALPSHKRDTRISRLEAYARKLVTLKTASMKGYYVSPCVRHSQLDFSTLLTSSTPLGHGRNVWPMPPFLVAAAMESLRQGPYARQIVAVPGEADTFCAARAKRDGGLVLSADSDLLVHDLGGHAAYAPFQGLELNRCSSCHSDKVLLQTRIYHQFHILDRLDTKDLPRVAFEIFEDATISLSQAVQCARKGLVGFEAVRFQQFLAEYDTENLLKNESSLPMLREIDPRVGELVVQVEKLEPETKSIAIYLPLLHEDPARACAWAVCQDLRALGYAVLLRTRCKCRKIPALDEVVRSGPGRIVKRTVEVPRADALESTAQGWLAKLDRSSSKTSSNNPIFWRSLATEEDTCDGNDELSLEQGVKCPVTGLPQTRMVTWQEIQLNTQVQAVQYSFRMVKQLLQCAGRLSGPVAELCARLQPMPELTRFQTAF